MAAVLMLAEGSAPSTPASTYHDLYVAADGAWHILDDAGADRTLATTADVFATANLADEAVTNAKLANMDEATIKGRAAAAGTGVPVDLSVAQVATILAGQFAPANEAAWTTLTLGANYTTAATLYPTGPTYALPGCRKVGGVVHLRGVCRTTATGSQIMATLPAGYRPEADGLYTVNVFTSSTSLHAHVYIYANGEMYTAETATSTFHLDGISFIAA